MTTNTPESFKDMALRIAQEMDATCNRGYGNNFILTKKEVVILATRLRDELAKQQGEPVAWLPQHKLNWLLDKNKGLHHVEVTNAPVLRGEIPLYLHPTPDAIGDCSGG